LSPKWLEASHPDWFGGRLAGQSRAGAGAEQSRARQGRADSPDTSETDSDRPDGQVSRLPIRTIAFDGLDNDDNDRPTER